MFIHIHTGKRFFITTSETKRKTSMIINNCFQIHNQANYLWRHNPLASQWILGTFSHAKTMAKQSNIVCQMFEIWFSSKVFYRLAISQNIACQTCFTWIKQKMFLNHFKILRYNFSYFCFSDVAKQSNIACTANLKCLTNNVWSFG